MATKATSRFEQVGTISLNPSIPSKYQQFRNEPFPPIERWRSKPSCHYPSRKGFHRLVFDLRNRPSIHWVPYTKLSLHSMCPFINASAKLKKTGQGSFQMVLVRDIHYFTKSRWHELVCDWYIHGNPNTYSHIYFLINDFILHMHTTNFWKYHHQYFTDSSCDFIPTQ